MPSEENLRRDFIKVAGLIAGSAIVSPFFTACSDEKDTNNTTSEETEKKVAEQASYAPTSFGEYKKVKIGSLSQLKNKGELDFSYPSAASMCKAVFINGEAKAYSIICTHKGCPTSYNKETEVFECPCHFTKYDAKKNGQMIIGHATGGLPQVRLEIDGDSLYATGIDGLVFGRINNLIG